MAPVIEVENLRKVYQLRTFRGSTLKEMLLVNLFKSSEVREIVALDGISFALERGQTLAILGSNGSGKSTLLRILGGVTPATEGRVAIHGRTGSLIDLTAGLQPELNGIENIFFNASILGMPRRDIRRRVHDIMDFADIGPYIHTPVKYYSTGMLVRLAFSIAVHLDPEILLVDEALSVGDMYFQAKSLDRMLALKRERGVTILLVTHDMELAEKVADRVLWLDRGKQFLYGTKEDGIDKIIVQHSHHISGLDRLAFSIELMSLMTRGRFGSGEVEIRQVRFMDGRGREKAIYHTGGKLVVEVDYEVMRPVDDLTFGVSALAEDGLTCVIAPGPADVLPRPIPKRGTMRATLDPMGLLPGRYRISIGLFPAGRLLDVYDCHLLLYFLRIEPDEANPPSEAAYRQPAEFSVE